MTKKKIKHQTDEPLVLPHSIEAEQSVLGSVMIDNDAWDKVVELISEDDFYRPSHKVIFRAMSSLGQRAQPLDVLTLSEFLKSINQLENIGGEVYLFELANNTPTVANIVAYAGIVREKSILRQLVGVSREIADEAFNPEGRAAKEVLEGIETKIFKIADQRSRSQGPISLTSLLLKARERVDALYHSEQTITGVSTGFKDLDNMTSGLQNGDLIIIAGRPSMGKTSLAMNIVEEAITRGKIGALVFSMEMPGESLATRMLSSMGRIDQQRLRSGKLKEQDWARVQSTAGMLSELSMYVDDTASMSPAELRSKARRIARVTKNFGLIVIDYLQLMHMPGFREGRVGEITEISRNLKALAKELNVPVIALSQLNRGSEQRNDKRPQMSDLRESGAIEQDADVILLIYRDEVYNESSPDKGIAEVIIAKQRNGPVGKVKLTFLSKFTRFENCTQASVVMA